MKTKDVELIFILNLLCYRLYNFLDNTYLKNTEYTDKTQYYISNEMTIISKF